MLLKHFGITISLTLPVVKNYSEQHFHYQWKHQFMLGLLIPFPSSHIMQISLLLLTSQVVYPVLLCGHTPSALVKKKAVQYVSLNKITSLTHGILLLVLTGFLTKCRFALLAISLPLLTHIPVLLTHNVLNL